MQYSAPSKIFFLIFDPIFNFLSPIYFSFGLLDLVYGPSSTVCHPVPLSTAQGGSITHTGLARIWVGTAVVFSWFFQSYRQAKMLGLNSCGSQKMALIILNGYY